MQQWNRLSWYGKPTGPTRAAVASSPKRTIQQFFRFFHKVANEKKAGPIFICFPAKPPIVCQLLNVFFLVSKYWWINPSPQFTFQLQNAPKIKLQIIYLLFCLLISLPVNKTKQSLFGWILRFLNLQKQMWSIICPSRKVVKSIELNLLDRLLLRNALTKTESARTFVHFIKTKFLLRWNLPVQGFEDPHGAMKRSSNVGVKKAARLSGNTRRTKKKQLFRAAMRKSLAAFQTIPVGEVTLPTLMADLKVKDNTWHIQQRTPCKIPINFKYLIFFFNFRLHLRGWCTKRRTKVHKTPSDNRLDFFVPNTREQLALVCWLRVSPRFATVPTSLVYPQAFLVCRAPLLGSPCAPAVGSPASHTIQGVPMSFNHLTGIQVSHETR